RACTGWRSGGRSTRRRPAACWSMRRWTSSGPACRRACARPPARVGQGLPDTPPLRVPASSGDRRVTPLRRRSLLLDWRMPGVRPRSLIHLAVLAEYGEQAGFLLTPRTVALTAAEP